MYPPIHTPKQFKIDFKPQGWDQTRIDITGEQVKFSRPLASSFHIWVPNQGQVAPTSPKHTWSKQYIGTHAGFYKAGYRWGVSLGATAEAFKHSALYRPDGGINLPDGKYNIAFRAGKHGKLAEVIIAKEERGIDQRVFTALEKGIQPSTNARKEIFAISNHTMMASRGKPYDEKNADEFALFCAGEVVIINHRIEYINDQSGQFFGPNGVIAAPDGKSLPDGATGIVRQPDYETRKEEALLYARQKLEEITGHVGIKLVKVAFEDLNPTQQELAKARTVVVDSSAAEKIRTCLAESDVQKLLDELDCEPKKQLQLLKALGQNGSYRFAVFDLTRTLSARQTLKSAQAAKLAVELLKEPAGIGLFEETSPLFIPKVSDNTKRKLLAKYNSLNLADEMDLPDFVEHLKRQPLFMQLLMGRRIAGGFFDEVLAPFKPVIEGVKEVAKIFTPPAPAAVSAEEDYTPGLSDNAEFLYKIETAHRRIREIEKAIQKKGVQGSKRKNREPRKTEIVLLDNPFHGLPLKETVADFHRNFRKLRALHKQGVPIYRARGTYPEQMLGYLSSLYSGAYPPTTSEDAVEQHTVESYLAAYGIDIEDLKRYTRERFEDRWSNKLILVAYANENKAFRRLLKDLTWFKNLPEYQPSCHLA